jgi:hypothetical protein
MRLRPLVDTPVPERAAAIDAVLDRFGAGALRVAANAGTRLVLLRAAERYRDRSRALRRLAASVDDWPVPPAGLFVVEERTVYLRSCSPMTVAHEFAHALDCALGGGVYLSGVDPRIRRAFREARAFVTPYAASGLDEYFAVKGNWTSRPIAEPHRSSNSKEQALPSRVRPSGPTAGSDKQVRPGPQIAVTAGRAGDGRRRVRAARGARAGVAPSRRRRRSRGRQTRRRSDARRAALRSRAGHQR